MTREEAIAILVREIDEDIFVRTEYREQIHEALNMGIEALKQESKTGHWIHHNEIPFKRAENWECSKCHRTVMISPFIVKTSSGIINDYTAIYFCPKCGVRMENKAEE